MDDGLNQLWNIRVLGSFGVDNVALLWLTVAAVVMYAGPAIVSLLYVLARDKASGMPGKVGTAGYRTGLPSLRSEPSADSTQKKAA